MKKQKNTFKTQYTHFQLHIMNIANTNMKYDLFCFGRANTDYISEITDEKIITDFKLAKGTGTVVSYEIFEALEKELKNIKKTPGGGTANLAAGFAKISKKKGLKTGFACAVGEDENGEKFIKSMQELGVDCFATKIKGNSPTCIVLITKDKERTFAVLPGISNLYKQQDLPYQAIANSKIFHNDTYELFTAQETVLKGIKIAKENKNKISFDLANEKIIEKEKIKIFKILLETNILFANEREFNALVGEEYKIDAIISKIQEWGKIESAILKLGEKGAYIIGNNIHKIDAYTTKVIDTNGAGDAFAAGFLYGILIGYDKEFSGKIGSYYASKIVAQKGPRLEQEIEDIEKEIMGLDKKGI